MKDSIPTVIGILLGMSGTIHVLIKTKAVSKELAKSLYRTGFLSFIEEFFDDNINSFTKAINKYQVGKEPSSIVIKILNQWIELHNQFAPDLFMEGIDIDLNRN